MCGISAIVGEGWSPAQLDAMMGSQRHRGPDMEGCYFDPSLLAGLGLNRLSIIDLSAAGRQPMTDSESGLTIVFNGEIYNYLELRQELDDFPYRSRTDTEVVLAAYRRWGEGCLDHFIGMFAFLIWDERKRRLFAARDRFGVKPLYYSLSDGGVLLVASEIRALHAAGVDLWPDPVSWATYLVSGLHDHSERTFWQGVCSLPPGHWFNWEGGELKVERWYDLAERVGIEFDRRTVESVAEEYLSLLEESIRLRFRSDVPVGINLSGGLDSSLLFGLVQAVQGAESKIQAFTYITGDPRYDELPWVEQMLADSKHASLVYRLLPSEVPSLAESVQQYQSEPFGGLPTLAYARLFECARENGVIVVMDGQGMDEQWAGYDYYEALSGHSAVGLVQGAKQRSVRPECLVPEFRALAQPFCPAKPFPDALRNRQYLDVRYTKIPRALRFNDRISMRSSTELREPFMDHRLFELALRQPADRKIRDGVRKWLPRQVARCLLPAGVVEAPKRPLQTPQREWLAGSLRDWCTECIQRALIEFQGEWLDARVVRANWKVYLDGQSDNSFYIWQWVSLSLMLQSRYVSVA